MVVAVAAISWRKRSVMTAQHIRYWAASGSMRTHGSDGTGSASAARTALTASGARESVTYLPRCPRKAAVVARPQGGRLREISPCLTMMVMSELHDECGVAAIYHLPGRGVSPLVPEQGPEAVSRLMPRMLLDIQNRGQLAAGMTTFNPQRNQLIDTYKDVGTVSEVFRMNHRGKYESLMEEYAGRAAIGHVRYATCGADDRSYAQPFERHHIKKHKWFSFAFNGQLANYPRAARGAAGRRRQPPGPRDRHRNLHAPDLHGRCRSTAGRRWSRSSGSWREQFDGAYSLVFLDALGDMVVARDPLGIKPLCYAVEGPLFAAASESVALLNLGFAPESIKSVPPGQAIVISDGRLEIQTFAASRAPGPLLLRVGLFRQRGQHAGRPQRLPGPQGPGRGAGPAGNGAHRRRHGRGARARHEQGRGRRHGLRA